ncbi:MAG: hypothetical protein ABSE68_00665 [Minisyncoccia bacterium]
MEHFNLTKKLHTDVLEEKYGPIHSEVLRHDGEVREVNMVDGKGVSRTYALTFLTFDKNNPEITGIDLEIKNGGLIGKTFREHGYEVRKNVISVFLADLPESLKNKMQTAEDKAKTRLSEFYAKKDGEKPFIYGVVSEIYSPDFRPPEVNETDLAQDNPITSAMEKVGISKEMIWERLGTNFDDVKDKFDEAKVLAESEESILVTKVKNHLASPDS